MNNMFSDEVKMTNNMARYEDKMLNYMASYKVIRSYG